MARTYRTCRWDINNIGDYNEWGHHMGTSVPPNFVVPVRDAFAFTFKDSYDSLWDAKLRYADDLAYANEQIRHALADF